MEGLIFIIVTIIGLNLTRADDWTYWGEHGPEHWPGVCATGKKQSPIDIVSEDAVKTDLGPLKFIRYDFAFSGLISNTGHSVQIHLDGVPIHLEGGSLPSTYVLEQMHFHWPAEHTVDGDRDALELHFVHYDKQYDNVSTAAQHENGIAVVATLFELSNEDNLDIMPIIKSTNWVSKWVGKSTTKMSSKIIPFLFLPKDHTSYYRYDGSLTTPGCQESVMWFVMLEKLPISEHQLDVFKGVETSNGTLKYNWRPTQPIHSREIFHHLDGYSTATSLSANLFYTLIGFPLVRLIQSSH